MRRLFHAPLVLSALAVLSSLAVAADPVPPTVVVVPRPAPAKAIELKATKGQVVTLSAGSAKAAKWRLIDADTADLEPNGLTAAFTASADGRYRVIAAIDGDLAFIVVVVGSGPPPPGPPDPPMPPAPDSPLRKKLKAAFDADPAAAAVKRNQAGQLAAVYKNAAAIALVSDPTSKKFAPTVGELIRRVKDAAADVTDDELVGVRKAAAEELAAIFAEDGDLTAEQRTAAAKLFTDLAAILDSF